jgi:DNA-binding MarR family transcriptional regulator
MQQPDVSTSQVIDAMSQKPPTEQPTGCACLRLRKVTRRVTKLYDQVLATAGLTGPQFSVLAHLQSTEDPGIGELADRLVMDPTTLTRALGPLERQGFVAVVASAQDRRRRVVVLTAAGRAAFRKAVPLWHEAQLELARQLGRDGFRSLIQSLDFSLERLADA